MVKQNTWKIIAIVFIILFAIETTYVIWATQLGYQTVDNDYNCAYDYCADYDTYNYDYYTKECLCFENHEVVKQQIMP
jgi:hypothetical protein